jgi:DNA repair protein RecO (recombination protein O)
MEWTAPAVVLDARPYGEADMLVTVMTEAHGLHRGLARAGAARGHIATWQPGNMLQVHWLARLADQLGSFSGDMIYPAASHAMDDPLALAMLSAICATAEGALPERQPHPRIFAGLISLLPRVTMGEAVLGDLIQWEMTVLSDLGYGLDLSVCAVTGETANLAFVSPKTGRAVTREGAGVWASRLLPLPGFLVSGNRADAIAWRDGLRLTGHFLARDAFGHHHRPLPRARIMLYDRVAAMAAALEKDQETQHAG